MLTLEKSVAGLPSSFVAENGDGKPILIFIIPLANILGGLGADSPQGCVTHEIISWARGVWGDTPRGTRGARREIFLAQVYATDARYGATGKTHVALR